MASIPRRRFLQDSFRVAAGTSAGLLCGRTLFAQSSTALTRVYLDSRRMAPAIDRNLFGSFLEHLGRAIYQGIYQPDSKLADANGFRKDMLEEIRRSPGSLSRRQFCFRL